MKSEIIFGFENDISDFCPKGFFLFLGEHVPALADRRRPVLFKPHEASFNILARVDYHYATYFVSVIDALFPGGENTLTREDGLAYLLDALLQKPKSLHELVPKPDKSATNGHKWAYNKINRILASPVLNRVFDPDANQFQFTNRVVLAELNRADLTDFDARVLAYFLIGQTKEPVLINDLNFYGGDFLIRLIRENRLKAGVRSLQALARKAPELHDEVLSVFSSLSRDDQYEMVYGVLHPDAVVLAEHAGLRPDPQRADNDYNKFISHSMSRHSIL